MTVAALPNGVANPWTDSPVATHVSARPAIGAPNKFCHIGDDLQAKINGLVPGDVMAVDANVDFAPITLPARSDAGWITIISSDDALLPAIGTRISPSDSTHCWRINATGTGSAITITDGTQGWYFKGLHCASGASADSGRNMISILGNGIGGHHALGDTEAQRFIFQHVLMDFADSCHVKRGILANGRDIRLADSYLDGFRQSDAVPGADSQGWCAYDCSGVHRIDNTLLGATAENLLYGGADCTSVDFLPSDIEIIRCTLRKNPRWNYAAPEWNGSTFLIKAGLELKMCQRVLIEGCELYNSWLWATFTLDNWNQDGGNSFSTVADVVIRSNKVHSVGGQSSPIFAQVFTGTNATTQGVHRVLFINNLGLGITWVAARDDDVQDHGIANKSGQGIRMVSGGAVQDISAIHNTIASDEVFLYLGHQPGDGMAYPRTTFHYNVGGFGRWGMRQENQFPGFLTTATDHDNALSEVGVATDSDQFVKNAFFVLTGASNQDPSYPPPWHNEAAAWNQAKFINPDSSPIAATGVNTTDGTLNPGSPLIGSADSGTNFGVDFDVLQAALTTGDGGDPGGGGGGPSRPITSTRPLVTVRPLATTRPVEV